ncbi:MAG: glycosyltransferase family 2 protein [Candidatus Omnitrophota bacterium]|jgi:hypothetical protein
MVDLSISIISYNVKDYLDKCLTSIFKEKKDLILEIIVVDNNSSDGSIAMVREKFPDVKPIGNKENLGFAKANNIAIKQSCGRYILILNPDTIVLPGSMQLLVDFLDKNSRVGAVGPKILNEDSSIQLECARNFPTPLIDFFILSSLYKRFPKSKIFGKYLMSYWDHNDGREVPLLSGACMLLRRSALEEVGLFDENFFMYTEDTDLCYRVKKAGWKVWYLPEAEIIHFGGRSSEQIPYKKEMVMHARETMEAFYLKHYGMWAVVMHRLTVIITMIWLITAASAGYLLGPSSRKQKFKNIIFRSSSMLQWAFKPRIVRLNKKEWEEDQKFFSKKKSR